MGAQSKERPGNPLPPRGPSKYAQGQVVSRDGPPLGDMVAATVIFRFSPHTPRGQLEILGVEDYDPRKSKRRFTNTGVHSSFCLCLPSGRQQTDKQSGGKDAPHLVARKEAQEEAGVSLSLNELFPILVARRVARGETGRDSFDTERSDNSSVIYFDHVVFVCCGENIVPGTPREESIRNPAWYSVEEVLDPQVNQLWSFDHVTLIVATLKILGDMCRRWIRGEWTPPEESKNTGEESLGSLFFERLGAQLQKSPEALSAMARFAVPGDSGRDFHEVMCESVAQRQTGSPEGPEERREQAKRYLGMKHEREAEELQARIVSFQADVNRAREYVGREEKRATTSLGVSSETEAVRKARGILKAKESRLQKAKGALLYSFGKFVHGSFRPFESAQEYFEAWREIEHEKAHRVEPIAPSVHN